MTHTNQKSNYSFSYKGRNYKVNYVTNEAYAVNYTDNNAAIDKIIFVNNHRNWLNQTIQEMRYLDDKFEYLSENDIYSIRLNAEFEAEANEVEFDEAAFNEKYPYEGLYYDNHYEFDPYQIDSLTYHTEINLSKSNDNKSVYYNNIEWLIRENIGMDNLLFYLSEVNVDVEEIEN